MAEVFKAKSVGAEGFEKLVAIKRILPSVAEDAEFIRMFVDEAKITATLSHPNLAQTFDLGRIRDTWFIAMEYVPGKDLRAVFERLKRRGDRMPLRLAAWAMARVCDGLDCAHRKRDRAGEELHIVHRDVSPQNVMVSFDGEVKLIDFGIARSANKMSSTEAGILKGKFGYMSPEQVRGLPLDRRSDVFAAGVVLYELCTGERLFTGGSDFAVLDKVQAAKVPQPSRVNPAIPAELEKILLKALAREAHDRYAFAADMAEDLNRFLLAGQERVSRDDLALFMRATFPEDSAREQAGLPRDARAGPSRPPPAAGPARSARQRSMDDLAAAERLALERQLGLHEEPEVPVVLEPLSAAEPWPARDDTGPVDEPTAPRAQQPRPSRRSAPPRPPPAQEKVGLAESALPSLPLDAEIPARAEPSGLELAAPAPAEAEPLALDLPAAAGRGQRPAPEPLPEARPRETRPPPRRPRARPAEPAPRPAGAPSFPRKTALAAAAVALLAVALGVAGLKLWKAQVEAKRPLGVVTIVADPEDAEVSLDGAQLKDALDRGATEVRLAPDIEHVLVAHREGFSDRVERVTVARGDRLRIHLVLQPPPGALRVLSTPPGARIVLDGRDRGTTPASLSEVDPARAHVLTLEKRCFAPFTQTLAARSDSRAVDAVLQPLQGACATSGAAPRSEGRQGRAGFLSLASRPSANVSIDGRAIGRATPLSAWPLEPGRHVVKLARGSMAKELSVEIRGGETHSEIVDLRN